jgi:hypothetical protein
MIAFVYLRNAGSRSLLSEQLVAGYHIHEAFTVFEAVWLCTQQHLGIIVIADNLECSEVSQVNNHYVTLRLTPQTTMKELFCHLASHVA